MSGNALAWLPDTFSTLSHLAHLDVSHSNLTSSIPPSLLNSTTLASLALTSNALTEPVNVNAPKLRSLELSDNQVTSIVVTSGPALSQVRAARNRLTGPLPDLGGALNLTVLDVSDNQ